MSHKLSAPMAFSLIVLACAVSLGGELSWPPGALRGEWNPAALPAPVFDQPSRPRQAVVTAAVQELRQPAAEPGAAQAPLTLADLEQMALECNPTLRQARMAVRAAQGAYIQAGLYPNPSLDYVADEIGNDGSAGLQGGGVTQEVVTAGKRRLARAATGHAVQAARHQLEMQKRKVLNDVRAEYYGVLVAQRTVEVNEQLVRLSEEAVGVTEKLREAQEVSQADVIQARIEAETARLGLNQARYRYRAAWQRLCAVVGRPDLSPAPLAAENLDAPPEFTFNHVLAQLLAQSPELSRARAEVRQARCELDLQYALRVPNVEIGSAVKYDDASGYTVVDVAASLPLPLFDRNQGNILAAQARLTAAEEELRRIELELRERLAGVFEQYATARRQVEAYSQSILPAAQQSLELVTAGYRAGEFSFLALLTAQRTYFAAQLDYLSSLGQLWAATVQLEGLLLTGGLEKPQ